MTDLTAPTPSGARHDITLAGIAGGLALTAMLAARLAFGEPVIEREQTGTDIPSATQAAPAQPTAR